MEIQNENDKMTWVNENDMIKSTISTRFCTKIKSKRLKELIKW